MADSRVPSEAAMPYRKRAVEVKAIQYLPGKTCRQVAEFMNVHHDEANCFDDAEWGIPTLEGLMWARPGDWIIEGVQGEFYPCKPDIFAATYEPVYPLWRLSPDGSVDRVDE